MRSGIHVPLLALAALAGCAATGVPAPRGPSEADLSTMTTGSSNGGTYFVAWRPNPDPIPVEARFSMEVWVLEGATLAPVGDVSLDLHARATEHEVEMGVAPGITTLGPGHFRADAIVFHLRGLWDLYLDVTADGVTERSQFSLTID